MSNVNFIHLVGNLVDDPELRYTTNGKPVANMRIAVNDRIKQNGEWVDKTTFVNVVCWDKLGENTSMSARKGDRVSVQGRLQIRSYDDQNGVKHYRTEVVADSASIELRFQEVEGVRATAGPRANTQALATAGAPAGDPEYGDEAPF